MSFKKHFKKYFLLPLEKLFFNHSKKGFFDFIFKNIYFLIRKKHI